MSARFSIKSTIAVFLFLSSWHIYLHCQAGKRALSWKNLKSKQKKKPKKLFFVLLWLISFKKKCYLVSGMYLPITSIISIFIPATKKSGLFRITCLFLAMWDIYGKFQNAFPCLGQEQERKKALLLFGTETGNHKQLSCCLGTDSRVNVK